MAAREKPNVKAGALGGAVLLGAMGWLISDAGYDPDDARTKKTRATLGQRVGLIATFTGIGGLTGAALTATAGKR